MATTKNNAAKSNSTPKTARGTRGSGVGGNTTNQRRAATQRSDVSQVREGFTKLRKGAADYVSLEGGQSRQVREGFTKLRNGTVALAQHSTERAVDVPVGAALSVADRVNEIVEPWTSETTRERELKSVRTRIERDLNRFERRGGTARRKATQRVRKTRNRVEREAKQNRQKAESTLKENRRRAEDGLKKARTTVEERVSTLV